MLTIILWLVGGAFVGWIASMIAGTNHEQGAIGNIVVGIIGAFLGGWLMSLFGGQGITGFNFTSFLVALLGAVILSFVYRAVRGGTHNSSVMHR